MQPTEETSTSENPVGLYLHKESGAYIGCIHPVQADAAVRVGYKLVKEGKDAAMMSDDDIAKATAKVEQSPAPKEEAK